MNRATEKTVANYIEQYRFACKIAKNKSVLDVACGPGHYTALFLEAGVDSYVGIDIDEKHLEYARYKYKNHISSAGRVDYHAGDIVNFNNGRTFDVITCYGIIEHIKDYEAALSNLHGLLNRGGILLVSSPNRLVTSPRCVSLDDKPANKNHRQEFTPNELLLILNNCGFMVTQDHVFGQYQRRLYSNKLLDKFNRTVFKSFLRRSPEFLRVKEKEPEHFIVVARKI